MKLFKILSNPYTLIICFLAILINGEQWGGFYAFYVLIALPFGGVHALLAVAGILILISSQHWKKNNLALRQYLNISGVIFLFGSLYFFFINDNQKYNWGTFHETIPLITIVASVIVAICFLIKTFISIEKKGCC